MDYLNPWLYETQPDGMLQPVIVMLKGIAGVIRWVYAGALYLSGKVLLKGFQGKEIIAIDKHVTHPFSPPWRGLRGGYPSQEGTFKLPSRDFVVSTQPNEGVGGVSV